MEMKMGQLDKRAGHIPLYFEYSDGEVIVKQFQKGTYMYF